MCFSMKTGIENCYGMKLEGGFVNLHNGGVWNYEWISTTKVLKLDIVGRKWQVTDVDWELPADFVPCVIPHTPDGVESGKVIFPDIDIERGTEPAFVHEKHEQLSEIERIIAAQRRAEGNTRSLVEVIVVGRGYVWTDSQGYGFRKKSDDWEENPVAPAKKDELSTLTFDQKIELIERGFVEIDLPVTENDCYGHQLRVFQLRK